MKRSFSCCVSIQLPLAAAVLAALMAGAAATAEDVSLKSPDANYTFAVTPSESGAAYSIEYGGQPIITPSRLGLKTERGLFDGPWAVQSTDPTSSVDTVWSPVHGERAKIRDHYHESVVHFRVRNAKASPTQYGLPESWRISVRVRCYDEGVAFRYEIPAQLALARVTTLTEETEFRFPADWPVWTATRPQGDYRLLPTRQIRSRVPRPCVAEGGDVFVAIGEAALVDFARMQLERLPEGEGLKAALDGPCVNWLPFATPWRVVMAAPDAATLLANNDLFRNLNEPCAIADPSWIRPGKLLRDVSLTAAGAKRCIDYAAANGLQYIMWDAGWYGPEGEDASNAATPTVDREKQALGGGAGALDLHGVVQYGRSKGIGLVLYINHRVMEKQLDEILPLYREWGIAGVKYGFVRTGSQEWTEWLHRAIRKAADNRLVVNVHDDYRPTGYARTYPNLLTIEGVKGDEQSPPAGQTLAHLFNRWLCGAADNTFCYFDPRVGARMTTHAGQLAKGVLCYSPLQSVHWYDRPPKPGETPRLADGLNRVIGNEPELEWWAELPVTWDDTRVMAGKIGGHAVIARRSGKRWWVGFLNAEGQRTHRLSLDFLEAETPFTARIYVDDPKVETRTRVRIDERDVDNTSVLVLTAGPNAGVAVRIEPKQSPISH